MIEIRISLVMLGLIITALGCKPKLATTDSSPGGGSALTSGDGTNVVFEKKRRGKITIGKDTTYATGPLDKNGYVDYAAALNERMGKGVTPENNANVLLWKALGPYPEGGKAMHPEFFRLMGIESPPEKGDYFIDMARFDSGQLKIQPSKDLDDIKNLPSRAAQRSWTANDHPSLASWLKANEKPLALVVEATKRTHYFSPLVTKSDSGRGTLLAARMPGAQECRHLAYALAARAMLHAGEGRYDDAWQDLLACHRLGRLVGRGGTFIEGLVGFAVDGIASKADVAFLSHPQLTAKQIETCLHDLQKLPPMSEVADKVELGERFTFLDEATMVDFLGIDYLESLSGGKLEKPDALVKQVREQAMDGIEWDPGLRNANRWYDRLGTAMREKDCGERQKKLAQIDEELTALKQRFAKSGFADLFTRDAKERGATLGKVMIGLLLPGTTKAQGSADRGEQTERNLCIAFALAAYQRDNSRYPEKLDLLVPKYLAKIPIDMFTGKPLIYRPAEKGYLLYSFGPNGKDDEGRGNDDDPKGDDLSVRMPLPKLKD
jgi:hypothetical protein